MTVPLRDEPIVPSDTEAEGKLLGAALLDAAVAVTVTEKHKAEDFFYKPHIWVLNALGAAVAAGEPVSPASISRRLAKMRAPGSRATCLAEMGGEDSLFALLNGVDPSEAAYWGTTVVKTRKQRDLFRLADKARTAALNSPDIDATLAEFEVSLNAVADATTGAAHVGAGMDNLRDRILRYVEEPGLLTGLTTGWEKFDAAFDGIQKGSVTLVYGPTSRNKSLFLENMMWRFARNASASLGFSTEMPRIQVNERLLQLESGLNLKWIKEAVKDGKDSWSNYMDALGEADLAIRGYPIFQNDRYELDIAMVMSEIGRQVRWNNVEVVFIDLIDGITAGKLEGIPAEEYVAQALKGCALKNNVAIVATAHTNKPERGGDPAILPLARIKGAASKGQDADNAVSLNAVTWSYENQEWFAMADDVLQRRVDTTGLVPMLAGVTKARNGERPIIPFEVNWQLGGRMFEVG